MNVESARDLGPWVKTDQGRHLAGRRSSDTQPELLLRRVLHRRGVRYRVNRRLLGRVRPDICFGPPKVAVFVDGCFWHGCPVHGTKEFRGPNAERWRDKLATNQRRDRANDDDLEMAGWVVVRFWECEVLRGPEGCADTVQARIAGRSGG